MKKHRSVLTKFLAVFLSVLLVSVLAISMFGIYFAIHFKLYTATEAQAHHVFVGKELLTKCQTAYDLYMNKDRPTDYFQNTNFAFEITDENGNTLFADMRNAEILDQTKTTINGLTVHGYLVDSGENIFTSSENSTRYLFGGRYLFIVLAIVSFALLSAVLFYIFTVAGYRGDKQEAENGTLEKAPFGLLFLPCAALGAGSIYAVSQILKIYTLPTVMEALLIWACSVFVYALCLLCSVSFAVRIKTGTFVKNTLLYMTGHLLCVGMRKFAILVPTIWKALLACLIYVIFEGLILFFGNGSVTVLLLTGLKNLIFIPLICYTYYQFKTLQKNAEIIAGGDAESVMDVSDMSGDFRKFGEALNNIDAGMRKAIAERTKSERMKAELITNVSHDIKTPLTSIIGYVDLLKQENVENEKVLEYLAVLDRQSVRLKKLIGDLVEASKASSGSIHVNKEDCDIGVLLQQSCGEYDEKFKKANLEPILHIPEDAIVITADGRLLWRVFDNLLSNICKYSMAGTRVYLEAEKSEDQCVVNFKNISGTELNIPVDELTERFVRADSSRSTEGSGLGLSIATSLVELQGGKMKIATDGDLFKVCIHFPLQKNSEEETKNPDV